MTYRIATQRMTETFINQIFIQQRAAEAAREQVATGRKVNLPADDPARAGSISNLQAAIQRMERHQERIAFATNFLEIQETTLESAENVLIRAQELAAQGANETYSEQERSQMGDEVLQLRDQLVSLANTQYQGAYIYSGAADDEPAFDLAVPGYLDPATGGLSERYVFSTADGATETREVKINDTDSVQINTSGKDVFENAIAGLERLARALKGYSTTLDAGTGLPDGGGVAYTFPDDFEEQTADIRAAMDAIEAARVDELDVELSSVGSRMNRLVQASETLDSVKINAESARATMQDADLVKAISDITNLETGLQALMSSGVRISSLSLLDYL